MDSVSVMQGYAARLADITERLRMVREDAVSLALDLQQYSAEIEKSVPPSEQRDLLIQAAGTLQFGLIQLATMHIKEEKRIQLP